MEIVYCDACGMRISEAELKAGAVHDTVAGRCYCPKCAPASRQTKIMTRPASGENLVNRPSRAARATPAQTRVPVSGAQRQPPIIANNKPKLLIYGGAAAGLFGLVLIALSIRGGKKVSETKAEPEQRPAVAAVTTVSVEKTKPVDTPPVVKAAKPAEIAAQPAVAQLPFEKPPIPAQKTDPGMDDIRERFAVRRWAELKAEAERGGPGILVVRKRVKDFSTTYSSTASGKEAAELYKQLTANDPPPPGTNVFASYKRDFRRETPAAGWRYLWNQNGGIGESSKYGALVWNEKHSGYYSDPQNHPVGVPAGWINLLEIGGHPGSGDSQGAGTDRFAIAAYTLQPGQSGKTAILGTIVRPNNEHGGKVEFRIYVNDVLKMSASVSSSAIEYSLDLGVLKEGDTIFAAAGPDHDDSCDSFHGDFTIYPIP